MNYPSFGEDLEFSKDPSLAEIMDTYYREFFSAYGGVIEVEHVEDIQEQRKGYDKVVKLETDQFFRIEEKFDRKIAKTGNFFIETWSDLNKKKGWIYTSRSDYIAYHNVGLGITYMLPTPTLRRAWKENEAVWRDSYREVFVPNDGWTSMGLLVPIQVLREAMITAMIHNHEDRWNF